MLAIYLLIVAAGLIGVTITVNIYKKKHTKKPLVCPFNADCDSVITSDFSSFWGIGLEIYGMCYYGLITLIYGILIFFPQLQNDYLTFVMSVISTSAFLFSLYLTFLQAFILRIWCSWCLMSAGISTSIFIFAMIGNTISGFSFVPILVEYNTYLTMLHLLGFAIGVGAATISDVLFLRFLKDFRITKDEKDILQIMSQIIWFALLIIIVSSIGRYMAQSGMLLQKDPFVAKMIVLAVIFVNGIILNLTIMPKLISIAWKPENLNVKKIVSLSNLAFATGAISIVSWYTALFLGFLENISYSFNQLVSIYGGALLVAIVVSQVVRKMVLCTTKENPNSTIVH